MVQRVNLLDPSLIPRKEPLTAVQFGLGWAAIAGMLLVVTVVDVFRVSSLRDAHADLDARWRVLKQAGDELRAKGEIPIDRSLKAEVERLRETVEGQQKLAADLSSGGENWHDGFSGYLADLARSTTDGLWLSEIALVPEDNAVTLKGSTVAPVQVPRFLQLLAEGQQFTGQRFASVELTARDDGVHDFQIAGPVEEAIP